MHRQRILYSIRLEGKIIEDVRDLLEGEATLHAVRPIVLQPHRQRPVWRELLRRNRPLGVLGVVVQEVEPLSNGAVARFGEDPLPLASRHHAWCA